MMKVRFLAVGDAPSHYAINGEKVTAYREGKQVTYDFSGFPVGAKLETASDVSGVRAVFGAARDSEGLHVTLAQEVGAGTWSESGWLNSETYDPDRVYVAYDNASSNPGLHTVLTRQGLLTIGGPDE